LHENPSRTKHVESVLIPCLDAGSTPAISTHYDADATTPDPIKPQQPAQQQTTTQPQPVKSPEQQYVELLNVKGIYKDDLRIAFNKMTIEQKRAEYDRVKGL